MGRGKNKKVPLQISNRTPPKITCLCDRTSDIFVPLSNYDDSLGMTMTQFFFIILSNDLDRGKEWICYTGLKGFKQKQIFCKLQHAGYLLKHKTFKLYGYVWLTRK